jgi:DNA (cytosine-5)-methyltransferase 1
VNDLSVVEICAGAGGQSLGLHRAGFRHELAVEIDETAASTLRHNLGRLLQTEAVGDLVAVGDVADEDVWRPEDYRGKASLLAGGVPCPPFSKAGRQLGAADERDLFAWAVKAAGRMQPEAVLLENVRGLGDARFGGYRQAVIDEFARMGYVADWELLQARDFGVPQLRPRMVLVALRPEYVEYFEWPEAKPTANTVGTVLADLMDANGFRYTDEWVERASHIAPTIVGGSKKHGGADLGPTRAKRAWEALWVDAHGVADHAPDETWRRQDHPRGPKLTTEMVARLQGWHGAEYEWDFLGGKTSRYRQIGNAFPPPVARAVGASVARALRKEGTAGRLSADRKMHDEVYRVLRDRDEWLTVNRIQKLLGSRLTAADITKRIALLGKDFAVESRVRGAYTAYKLGEWKAFQGQLDHDRHLAFADRKSRRRIS